MDSRKVERPRVLRGGVLTGNLFLLPAPLGILEGAFSRLASVSLSVECGWKADTRSASPSVGLLLLEESGEGAALRAARWLCRSHAHLHIRVFCPQGNDVRIILGQFDQNMAAKVFCCVSNTSVASFVSLGRFMKLLLGFMLTA